MKEAMMLRKATGTDAERIWQIILQAKEQMRLLNSIQWQNGYPAQENIASDIQKGYGYVLCFENRVIAYAAVVFEGEPAYLAIDGKWLSDEPYVVVHRLAVADEMKQRGIATLFMQKVGELSRERGVFSFRVDTNYDNFYMQKVFSKLDFKYCGEITYDSGKRLAYEKNLREENGLLVS